MNTKRIIFFLFVLFLLSGQVFTWVGCAQIVQPTGGPKDTLAPQLDSARSTINYQTNFEKQTIVLAFDEYIELRDVFNQVVISPPTEKRPEVKRVKYKRVELTFAPEEELRENATYTINFGEAIRDYTAGNVQPISFVFSTGPYLDSLEVHGEIRDAETNEPVSEVLLMLYDNLADTVVRTERPFYFARTDKTGHFHISNVKADTFRVFALEDQSSDYIFNQESERIGFPDDFLILTDSTKTDISIRFFKQDPTFRMLEAKHPRYGLSKLVFNGPPDSVQINIDQEFQNYYKEIDLDTMRIWYHTDTSTSWNIYMPKDSLIDTLLVPSGERQAFLDKTKPKPISNRFPTSHNPTKEYRMSWMQPISAVDTSLILVTTDTLGTRAFLDFRIDSLDKKTLILRHNWKEKKNYDLLFLPGAVTGFYGTPSDSLQGILRTAEKKDYGSLSLELTALDSTKAYVMELISASKVVEKELIRQASSWNRTYPSLKPGSYEVRIIEDLIPNGRWDPGNYDQKRQPERIFIRPLESLRANWEVDASFPVEFDSEAGIE
ncbi:MAG: hypothetical protein GYB31_18240 [Bacteroidetes bacterium]|nr:hypothetical protein [Bacteroidota bacterium]